MKRMNLKLFTVALAAVLPAFTNTLTAVSDSTGVHVNYAANFIDFGYEVVQITAATNTATLTGDDFGVNGSKASIGSNLASFSDVTGEHVFYVGWDCNVYQVLYPPTPRLSIGGFVTNLTNFTSCTPLSPGSNIDFGDNPPVSSGLTACSGAAGNYVFYVDNAGHLVMLSSSSGTPSNIEDLTATFGGPTVAYGSNLVSFCGGIGGQQVFYVDTNYNVNEFYFSPFLCRLSVSRLPICGPGWQNANLTMAAGGLTTFVPPQPQPPISYPGLALTGFQDNFGTHIFYVASNQNINQLFLPSGGAWSNQDVMPSAPLCILGRCSPPPPLPAANTALSSLTDPKGNQHVFYIDVNLGISELSHNPNSTLLTLGNGWFYGSVTTSGADSGCSMMQLTSLVDNTGAQRVYYVTASGDLMQLLLGPTSWTLVDLSLATGAAPVASGCAPGLR